MPRTATDYSKTVIYRISHKEIEGLDYVGSTTDFSCRKSHHKGSCINPNSSHHHYKLYQTIRDNGGWDCFQMLEIKKFPCTDNREAQAEEEKCRQEINAKLNMRRAFISEEERKVERNENQKKYYEINKEQLNERHKSYRSEHTDQARDYNKKYRAEHKEHLKN
jgi:hypothetical protein